MSIEEQQELKTKYYREAMRYMDNAKECLSKAKKEDDKKMLNEINSAYLILHLSGYYDGNKNAAVIKEGFDEAYKVIEKIRPLH